MGRVKSTHLVRELRVAYGPEAGGDCSDRTLLERFLQSRNEEAFALLVQRHGRTVRAACRQVLTDPADVDDAFQTTFLVLLRKARAVNWQESLGSWLYAVAHRIAVQSRANRLRREDREGVVRRARQTDHAAEDFSWREACGILHDELDRLPKRYRLVLLLCYLQSQSRDEAAQQLGWKPSVVKGCLERGRQMLARRLERRGITLSAGLLAVVVQPSAATLGPLGALVEQTVQAALTAPERPIANMVRAVLSMIPAKHALLAVAMALIGLVLVGVGVTHGENPVADKPATKAAREIAQPAEDKPANLRQVKGRVLDPDGIPVAGATIVLATTKLDDAGTVTELTKSDATGRFQCEVPIEPSRRWTNQFLVARVPGAAAAWTSLTARKDPTQEVELRLTRAEIPIRGRLRTLEGKPVPGAVVKLCRIDAPEGELNLRAVYKQWPDNPERAANLLPNQLSQPTAAGLPERIIVGADGTFEIAGVGDGRLLSLEISADAIAHQHIRVAVDRTFRFEAVRDRKSEFGQEMQLRVIGPPLHGPTFDHHATPVRVITGTVRDQVSGMPLADVIVSGRTQSSWYEDGAYTRTDAEGRYRLVGLANTSNRVIFNHKDETQGYLGLAAQVQRTEGLTPATCDMTLVRGVRVTGRVTDRQTGKPIRGSLSYSPLSGNKFLGTLPGKDIHTTGFVSYHTDADGRFQVTIPRGLGVFLIQADRSAREQPAYQQAHLRPEHKGKPYVLTRDAVGEIFLTSDNVYLSLREWHAYRIVDPSDDIAKLTLDFQLDADSKPKGQVTDK